MAPKRSRKRNTVTSRAISDVPRQFIGPPTLPLELILAVFESCARKEMLVLCRVSRTFQSWIYPLLYHTIVLKERKTCRLFQRTINTFKKSDTHASFLAVHTKVLIIISCMVTSADYHLNAILIACSNITTLSTRSTNIVEDMSCYRNFQYLTHLNMSDLFNSGKILPAGLTHISCDINEYYDMLKTDHWSLFLRQSPGITHLALTIPSTFFGVPRTGFLPVLALLPATLVRIIIVVPCHYSQSEDVPLASGRFSESYRIIWVKLNKA